MAWYDPSWLYRQKITIDHTLVAEDLTDFPVLITHAVVQASLFAHARSDGADIVVTASDETTRLKRELVTYDAVAGKLELYVKVPSLSSVTDTEVYVYYGNAGAAETNDADTWNADYGVVYHLKEDPAGTAPQAKDSTANAVHGTYDIAGRPSRTTRSGVASASSSTTARVCVSTTTRRSRTPIGSPSRPG